MTSMKTVQINTDQENKYISGDRATGHTVIVTPHKHWDQLSKIFKRYTHTIGYKGDKGEYNASNYTINVFTKGSRSSFFIFINPNQRVDNVEVYFGSKDDIKKKDPLVVGFIYQGSKKCYYAWSKLNGRTSTGTINGVESISEKDLVTVLLEEIGSTISRTNKLVIRLDEKQVGDHVFQYPDSGHYSGGNRKISVTKVRNTVVPGVEGYEHRIDTSLNLSEFYVSYLNNNRYFKTGLGLRGQHLDKVTAYFKSGSGSSKNLVLITFSFKKAGGRHSTGDTLYGYSYSDFVNELKKVTAENATNNDTAKTIDVKDAITDDSGPASGLKKRLEQEKEKLRPLISFSKENRENNENISDEQLEVIYQDGSEEELTFIKVTLKPTNAEDKPDGSSGGPWKVYNNQLFNSYEPNAKIDETVLTRSDIFTNGDTSDSSKYRSISVYYSTKGEEDYKALLVEFDASDMENKTYFKRTNKGGSSWEIATEINSDDTGVTASELTQIATQAKIIESSSVSSQLAPRGEDGPTDNTARNAGIAAGVVGVGAVGTGIAIYKNFAAVMGLIGKIF